MENKIQERFFIHMKKSIPFFIFMFIFFMFFLLGCTEGEDQEDGHGKGVLQSKKPVAEPIGKDCPLCGKPLIKRFAKRGGRPFVGCSGFPSCRHLENIDGTVIVLKERPAKKSAKSAKAAKTEKVAKTPKVKKPKQA
jgi:hypothetical protein